MANIIYYCSASNADLNILICVRREIPQQKIVFEHSRTIYDEFYLSFEDINVHLAFRNSANISTKLEKVFFRVERKSFIDVMFSGKIAQPVRSGGNPFIYLAMNYSRVLSTQSIPCF